MKHSLKIKHCYTWVLFLYQNSLKNAGGVKIYVHNSLHYEKNNLKLFLTLSES